MKELRYVVTDPLGIHARPAGILAKEFIKAKSDIKIKKTGDDRVINAKSIMAVMSLGVKKDQEILVTVEGEDEEEVIQAIEKILTENL